MISLLILYILPSEALEGLGLYIEVPWEHVGATAEVTWLRLRRAKRADVLRQ